VAGVISLDEQDPLAVAPEAGPTPVPPPAPAPTPTPPELQLAPMDEGGN
jgi:hypothetical protein